MSTNYYHHVNCCDACGRNNEWHIGKSSAGWVFSLCTHPDQHINSLADWQTRWGKGIIKDEYGNALSPAQMLEIITNPMPGLQWDSRQWISMLGHYRNESTFHEQNYSERGPNNLLRHRIDGDFCIGHGEGTWDLMKGFFC